MGPPIPLFWTSGDISYGFQSQSGQPWWRHTYYTFPEIHLWCNTCQSIDGQHGSHCSQCEIRQTLYQLSYTSSALTSILEVKVLWYYFMSTKEWLYTFPCFRNVKLLSRVWHKAHTTHRNVYYIRFIQSLHLKKNTRPPRTNPAIHSQAA